MAATVAGVVVANGGLVTIPVGEKTDGASTAEVTATNSPDLKAMKQLSAKAPPTMATATAAAGTGIGLVMSGGRQEFYQVLLGDRIR